MRLYLLRHGHAPPTQEAGVLYDSERPLSQEGRAQTRRSLAALISKGAKPDIILHSPLRRAQETAAIAHETLRAPLQSYPPLANTLPAAELKLKLLAVAEESAEILAVGHQPQIGDLAVLFCGRAVEMSTGGLAAIDISGEASSLLWVYNPG
ncbi:MAG: SixA phosphatase family protein [Elusimicrobiota bacterium]